jgi:hypothetical protein
MVAAPDDTGEWLPLADARAGELAFGTPPRAFLAGIDGGLLEISRGTTGGTAPTR